jgi:putative flippase GtrA
MKIVLTYIILALIATMANIVAQDVVMRFYFGAFNVVLSMLTGTATGLIIKYILDKRFIFFFHTCDLGHDARTFGLYATMGLMTTAIFWTTELTFDYLFRNDEMRYLGGVIGLAIGYLTKYQLDKRYVFRVRVAQA